VVEHSLGKGLPTCCTALSPTLTPLHLTSRSEGPRPTAATSVGLRSFHAGLPHVRISHGLSRPRWISSRNEQMSKFENAEPWFSYLVMWPDELLTCHRFTCHRFTCHRSTSYCMRSSFVPKCFYVEKTLENARISYVEACDPRHEEIPN
jgi:hypothetical protein